MTTEAVDLFAGVERAEPTAPSRCKVGRLLDRATAQSRELLLSRLAGEAGWTLDSLAVVLRRAGHGVAASSLSRHRSGLCICSPTTATEGAPA